MKAACWITRTALFLLLCGVLSTSVIAQRPSASPEDVVKVNTELVQTDFMVFDKTGDFVDGLKPDQFSLKVEGKSREIAFFDRVAAGSRNEEAQLAAARGRSAGLAKAVVPLDRSRVVMFFLDDYHLSLFSINETKALLKRFIDREMGQNDLSQIVSTSGQIGFLQQLTDNKSVLNAAVERLHYQQITPGGLADNPPMSEYQAMLIEQGDTDILDYFVDILVEQRIPRGQAGDMVKARAASLLKEGSSISTRSMSTFETWMKQTSEVAGRKLVFFISDGFLLDQKNSDNYARLEQITSQAARSGIVIYAIDARGLVAGGQEAATAGNPDPFGRLARSVMGEKHAAQEVLSALAVDTGGRAFFNRNDLSAAVTNALKETSIYYLLAWRPESDEQRNSKYRRIELSVAGHPDWTIRFRRGVGPTEATQAAVIKQPESDPNAAAARINTLLKAPFPGGALPVAITLNFFDTAERGPSMTTSIDVNTTSLQLAQENGNSIGLVDLGGAILNDEGKSVSTFNKRFTIRGPSDPTIAKPPEHLIYNHQASLKPGLYQVRIAAIDAKRGTSGSAHQWIEIPDLQTKKLALSTLIVGEQKEIEPAKDNRDNPTTDPLAQLTLNIQHRFAKTSALRFFTFIYNASQSGGAPDLAVQVHVFRDNEPVITTPLHAISNESTKGLERIPYAADVSLADLNAGVYVLQVTVIDRHAKSSAIQRFNFQIE